MMPAFHLMTTNPTLSGVAGASGATIVYPIDLGKDAKKPHVFWFADLVIQ
jgi:hypothetical protein